MTINSNQVVNTINNNIREDLVQTAIKFLENPNVIKTSLAEQQNFLKRKGLTDEEIRLACERSGAYTHFEENVQHNPVHNSLSTSHNSLFYKFREFVHNIALLSFIVYAVYKFYQKFIAPYLFAKKKKSIEESIEKLDKAMKNSIYEIKTNLTDVKIEVDKINANNENNTQRQLSDLKLEIATIKGLLLNRKLFPSVSPVVPPSIPAWQKTSISQESDAESDNERKDVDLCSAGSSDHYTQKSDSSLEIISYSSKEYENEYQRRKSQEEIID